MMRSSMWRALLPCAMMLVAGCGDPCKDADDLVSQAGALTSAREMQVKTYLTALGKCPTIADAMLQRGTQLLQGGQPDDATSFFKALAEFNPKDSRPLMQLGDVAKYKGNAKGALSYYSQARDLDPADPEVEMAIAAANLALNKPGEAIAALEAAKAKGAESLAVDLQLGQVALDQKSFDQAAKHFQSAQLAGQQDPRPPFGLGEVAMARSDYNLARAQFERAATMEPRFLEAHSRLGEIGILTHNLDLALKHMAQEAQLGNQDPRFLNNYAWSLFLANRNDEARQVAIRALQPPNQNDANLRETYAHILLSLGEAAQANAFFTEALKTRPEGAWTNFGLGKSFQALGNEKSAAGYLAKAAQLNAGKDPFLSARLREMGIDSLLTPVAAPHVVTGAPSP